MHHRVVSITFYLGQLVTKQRVASNHLLQCEDGASMSSTNCKWIVRLVFDFYYHSLDLQIVPFSIDEVFCFCLVKRLLP
jgi:hypothetical protein